MGGKTTGVDHQGDPVGAEHRFELTYILQGNRLSAAGVGGDRQHTKGDILRTLFSNAGRERGHIHVAFERALVLGRQSFGTEQIQRLAPPHIFDIGAGGIEMAVVGNDLPGPDAACPQIFKG